MMTKDQLANELKKEFAKGNLKPSQLKKSRSTGDLAAARSTLPLQKSSSQSEINLVEPQWKQQISSLQDELTTERKRVSSLREDLASVQDKLKAKEQTINELKSQNNKLEEQILAWRLKNLKEFGEYHQEKQILQGELEENIKAGTEEITKLENQLLALNRKKLQMQEQLNQTQLKNTQLELKALQKQPEPQFNPHWIIILSLALLLLLILKGKSE